MNQTKSVSILGCGWLGFPLAQQLLALGYGVRGSTTSPEKLQGFKEAGISPFLLNFNANADWDTLLPDFLVADFLVIAIPPGRTDERRLAFRQIFEVLEKVIIDAPIKQVVLISSTSIYGEHNTEVDEETLAQPTEPSGLLMLEIEQKIARMGKAYSLVRMAGLIGPGRHPGRFFAEKKGIPNGLAPVNLIHQVDAVNATLFIIENNQTGIINACAPSHPSRADFYTLAAQKAGLVSPQFLLNLTSWKQVNSTRLAKANFQFKYPDLTACI